MMAMMTMMMVIECELGNNLQRGQINWLLFGPNSALPLFTSPRPCPHQPLYKKKIYDGDENKIRRMLLVFLRGPHTWPKRLAAILMHGHGNAVRATASQNAQNDGQMDGWMD